MCIRDSTHAYTPLGSVKNKANATVSSPETFVSLKTEQDEDGSIEQQFDAIEIPLILDVYKRQGLGGISCANDAIEFLLAGASAIQIGTANFIDPTITIKVIDGINDYLDENGFKSVKEIIGLI